MPELGPFDPFTRQWTVIAAHFFASAYVVCDRCGGPAEVWARWAWALEGAPVPAALGDWRLGLICRTCPHRCELDGWVWSPWPSKYADRRGAGLVGKRSPRIERHPYWAIASGQHGELWIANRRYAEALRKFVHRPHGFHTGRNPDHEFADWRQRVPGWMKSRKGRAEALRLIDRAEARLDGIEPPAPSGR